MSKVPLVNLKDAPPKPDKAEVVAVVPMPEPVEVPSGLAKLGEPNRISVYRNTAGDACFAIMRWDEAKGKGDGIRPVIWDGKRFRSAGFPGKRPLYNSDMIAMHAEATVLVVEGEKTAETGVQYLPEGWVITTWAGGTGAVNRSDWSELHGRRVVIWPDNDTPGMEAAEFIADLLRSEGSEVGVVRPSKNYPEGWDLADELPKGVNAVMVMANLISAATNATSETPKPSLPAVDDEEDVDIIHTLNAEESAEFKALGYDDKSFYIMPAGTKIILKMAARELMSAHGCLQIVNDFDYWAEMFPAKRGSSSRADWEMAGSMIMRECQKVGFYDPRRLRGRGVWIDDGRVVVHTGETLIVDGRPTNPVMMKSKFIYKVDSPLFPEGVDLTSPATDADGRLVVELCNAPRWERAIFGDLLAGYIATSMVCGGLHWRTHVWVTGNSGSGKSTVINNIVSACVGDVALYPLGETTESGIRQTIGNDALPVIFDEMEGTDERGPAGANRRNAIIQLMRMASSESRGRIMKGSAAHQAVSFTMRSSFLVASIGMSLKEAPDLTRTMVLGLRPLMIDSSVEERAEAEQQWAVMNKLSARIPIEMPNRLFSRMTAILPVIRKNADMFREAITEKLGNRRLGDQIGTLLAGRFALTSKKLLTLEECHAYLERHEWDGVATQPSEREDVSLLNHLRQYVMRVQNQDGISFERTIGEMVRVAMRHEFDDKIPHPIADAALQRIGIKVDTADTGMVYLAKRFAALDRIMISSTNPTDWQSVISRYPGARASTPSIRFKDGGISRCICLPAKAWLE